MKEANGVLIVPVFCWPGLLHIQVRQDVRAR